MKRVVITGMGVVTPIGNDIESFSRNMFAGASGVHNVRGTMVAENFPVPYAAVVDPASIPVPEIFRGQDLTKLSKFWLMSGAATEQALRGLARGTPVDAVVYGTAEGVSFEVVFESLELLKRDHGLQNFDWRLARNESSLELLNDLLVAHGNAPLPAHSLIQINSACASGNQAVSIGFQRLRTGEWTRCLAGGVDARSNASSLMNFHMLSALATDDVPPHKASRPFAGDRRGFVRGEGAASLLMETLESAQARGAEIHGEVVGSANSCDAYRLTDGREDGSSVIHAMRAAIRDAHIETSQIDYINAHGTGTPLNDRLETQAIKEVFGDRAYRIPISSLKSQIGHSTVAAGALETIACLLMMREHKIAPTLNLDVPDPECDLDYVPNVARPGRIRYALNNSFGFGGQNSCLVLKDYTP